MSEISESNSAPPKKATLAKPAEKRRNNAGAASRRAVEIVSVSAEAARVWEKKSGLEDWIKIVEIIVGVLLLAATVYLGISANRILAAQNDIVKKQSSMSEDIGKEQNKTAILQSFISVVGSAGLDNERERRMLGLSLDLYSELAKDSRYRDLKRSLPIKTTAQLDEILDGKDKRESEIIRQLYGRTLDIITPSTEGGSYSIAVATYQNRQYADVMLYKIHDSLNAYNQRRLKLVVNKVGMYLIILSGFGNNDEASKASSDLGLPSKFSDIYISKRSDWSVVCDFVSKICDRATVANATKLKLIERPKP